MPIYNHTQRVAHFTTWCSGFLLRLALLSGDASLAVESDNPMKPGWEGTAPGEGFTYLGKITPRHARDIESSNWSIGAETMDRDFTIYKNWKKYLGPLGAKKARIQSGWAKTEKFPGKYQWDWLDEIILDMVDQGVEPWVCLCYGNLIYPGGGGTGIGEGVIKSEEAFQAWERYVRANVERYKEHVDEWELWNEPRTGRGEGAFQYAQFVIRTAEIIRKLQPDAEIIFAAGGGFDVLFSKEVLEHLREQNKLTLVNAVAYHPYSLNPDDSYAKVTELRKIVKSFATHIDILQGENGAPSRRDRNGAISKYDWTQSSQAKWALRRLLGDLGRDIPSSYFQICDMRYPHCIKHKGLLAINDDKTVRQVKPSYYAIQHVTAIFDNKLKRVQDFKTQITGGGKGSTFAAFGYRGSKKGPLVTLWRSSDTPDEQPELEHVTMVIDRLQFKSPVWIDLMSSRAYEIDDFLWKVTEQGTTFMQMPVYDSPVVIAEREEIQPVLALAHLTNQVNHLRGKYNDIE